MITHKLFFAGLLGVFMTATLFFVYIQFSEPIQIDPNILGVTTSTISVGLIVDTPRLGFVVADAFVEKIMRTLTGLTKIYIYPGTRLDWNESFVYVEKGRIYVEDIEYDDPTPVIMLMEEFDSLKLADLADNGIVKTDKLTSPQQQAWLKKLKQLSAERHLIKFGKINGLRSSKIELIVDNGQGIYRVHQGSLIIFDDDFNFVMKLDEGYQATFSFTGLVSPPEKFSLLELDKWWKRKRLIVMDLLRSSVVMGVLYLV